MAKHVFILEAHTWSFLSIFEAEPNLSHAYKKLYVGFVIKLFQCRKNYHWENRLSRWGNFMLSISHKQIPFPNQESYSKWAKIYLCWILVDS